jgi:putative peptide zinc metalloprotease protein
VELLGPLSGSGYRRPQALARRRDGQTVQLTPVLYALLELVDGRRGPDELAAALSESIGKQASSEDVRDLLDRLRPLGLLDGPEAEQVAAPRPLLGLRLRFVISDPAVTRRITAPFARLFRPYVVLPALVGFVALCWFVLADKGLASATHQAFFQPGLLLAVFLVTVLSAGFHEFGHAAACRYGGATPGAMGAGLYLVWPAFYTDVDDSYRLSRWGRLRVDLGGLYFNVIVADLVFLAWLGTRQDALLLGVATQLLQMLKQLGPFVRADGYHLLADLTGVPDLFHHLGPTLKRLLPWHWRDPSPLRRGARWTVMTWTVVVVPLLASMVLTGVLLFPRLVATAWAGGRVQAARLTTWDPVVAGAALLKLFALVLPVFAVAYMTLRLVRRAGERVWEATDDRPRQRAVVAVAALVALLLLLGVWWPSGQYRAVQASERGTLGSLVSAQHAVPTTRQVLAPALVPRSGGGPTLLLLPGKDGTQAVLATGSGTTPTAGTAFPFRLPTAPRPGDNQALALGTKDGGVVYDVAYALVTVTDGSAVTNANTAYALASCSYCTTVAVAFQVVLVVGQTHVVTPLNAAVAANADCLQCATTALAVQLVATLNALPSQEVYDQLTAALGSLDSLQGLDTAQLWQAVQQVQTQVLQVLTDAGLVEGITTATASASPSPSASSAVVVSSAPTPGESATASPGATAEPTAPAPSETPSPAPSDASPSPTPSG